MGDNLDGSVGRSISKSNVFLRAARSITKTKSVSGNFIVKTTITKSNIKTGAENKDTEARNETSQVCTMPDIVTGHDNSPQISPRHTEKSASSKHFMSMQMTPNPLIKNSFASPVKEGNKDQGGDLQVYQESSAVKQSALNKQFATMSSSKKPLRGQRDTSQHSNGATAALTGSALKSIPIQKIDISQFSNQMDHVPKIKGIKKHLLLQLYIAKCQDLVINTSKQQMLRFFDLVVKNHKIVGTRKLNLAEMALGDQSLSVICKIIKNNTKFAELDLSKNCFTNAGLKQLARVIQTNNKTLVHLSLGGNNI